MKKKRLRLTEHITELKSRLIKIIVCLLVSFAFSYYCAENILAFLVSPLKKVSGDHIKIIYTGLGEAFFTYITISAYGALFFSMPFILYQIYRFIAPGLYKREKKVVMPLFLSALVLFIIGVLFAYYFVFPLAWDFFVSFQFSNISGLSLNLETRVSEYAEIAIKVMIAFGIAFELPIILLILTLLDLISVAALKAKRRHAIVIIFVIAAVVTPPDIISQICLAVPLILLYEISIIIAQKITKVRHSHA